MTTQDDDIPMQVLRDSIEIGQFVVVGGGLRAELSVALGARLAGKEYRRLEQLTLFVEPHGDDIGVEVYDAILDFPSLVIVAEHVAVKLNTAPGRAALKAASDGSRRNRRRAPRVWVTHRDDSAP